MCLILGLVETVGIRLRISKELWEVGEFDVGVEFSCFIADFPQSRQFSQGWRSQYCLVHTEKEILYRYCTPLEPIRPQ